MDNLKLRLLALKDKPLRFYAEESFDDLAARNKIVAKMPRYDEWQAKKSAGLKKIKSNSEFAYLFLNPLLDQEQEQHLFKQLNFFKYQFSKVLGKMDIGSCTESMLKKAEDYWLKASAVKNQIVSSNVRLVASIAKKKCLDTDAYIEVISDGNLGLIRAVDYFDYRRGLRFSTYATWAIKDEINRGKTSRVKHSGFLTLEDALVGAVDYRDHESYEDREFKDYVFDLLEKVPKREKDVIKAYFGIGTRRSKLEDIGKRLKISKERARQIREAGLSKLRLNME